MAEYRFESFCSDGGETWVEYRCPATPSRRVVCSVHGDLGSGDVQAALFRHAGLQLPPDHDSSMDELRAEIRRRMDRLT